MVSRRRVDFVRQAGRGRLLRYLARETGRHRPDVSRLRWGRCPERHNGTAEWHPSGDYIVFTPEKPDHFGDSLFAEPGLGVYNDLWLMSADGSQFWQVTDGPKDANHGALHPHFSEDGTRLSWSEMHYGSKPGEPTGPFGFWYQFPSRWQRHRGVHPDGRRAPAKGVHRRHAPRPHPIDRC